jgi:Spy/CpxP family protein refolding chaperone
MNSIARSLLVGGCIAAATVAVGRAHADDSSREDALQAQAPAQARAASEAGGIVELVDEALSQVSLRPDQIATLQKLGGDVDAKVAIVDQAKRNLLAALGRQVEGGSIDIAALEPQIRAFIDESALASPALRGAMQKLHDTLDASQRQQFVAALANAIRERQASATPNATLERWSTTLDLTDQQKQQVGAILEAAGAAGQPVRARLERVLASFAEPSFSIDKVLPPSNPRARAERVASEIIEIAALVTHVLTPEQRVIAARAIERRAAGASTESPAAPGTAQSSSSLESTGSEESPLWAGGYRGFGGYAGGYRGYAGGYRGFGGYGYHRSASYHRVSGYGFGGGYGSGFGGAYMF